MGSRLRPGPPPARTVWTVLRAGSVAALVATYYLLPLDHASTPVAVTILIIGLVVFITLVAFHARSIMRSPFPQLLLFASSYVVLAAISTSNFGGRPSHTDGLDFAVTVFSTVGFGDAIAKGRDRAAGGHRADDADLIILGLAIKVVVSAVMRGQRRQAAPGKYLDPARPTSGADETR